MTARLRRLAAISAISLFALIGLGRHGAAIDLENDVSVVWSEFPFTFCRPDAAEGCVVPVFGAPRRLTGNKDALIDSAQKLKFKVQINRQFSTFADTLLMEVTALDPVLDRVYQTTDGLLLRFTKRVVVSESGELSLDLKEFDNFDLLERVILRLGPQDLILTVSGSFQAAQGGTAMIALSGPGEWIIADRLGDFDASRAFEPTDIPTRSIDVVRALAQLEDSPPQIRAVDMDIARPRNRAVGFTHALNLPDDPGIQSANLTLQITSDDPLNDFLLFDRGVRDAAANEPCVQAIALSRYLPDPPVPGTAYTLEIDLASVRVVTNYPLRGDPCPASTVRLRNLLPSLVDGRLDVIVGNRSTVDYSDLSITLRDP